MKVQGMQKYMREPTYGFADLSTMNAYRPGPIKYIEFHQQKTRFRRNCV